MFEPDHKTEPNCGGHDRRSRAAPPVGPEQTEALIALAERYLAIDNHQREAWEQVTGTVRDCVEAMQIAWSELARSDDRAVARFDRLAEVADVVSAAVRRLRPHLEALYGTLDAGQREALDRLIEELIGGRPPPASRACKERRSKSSRPAGSPVWLPAASRPRTIASFSGNGTGQ